MYRDLDQGVILVGIRMMYELAPELSMLETEKYMNSKILNI